MGGELKLPVPQLGWTKKPAVPPYAVPLGLMISNWHWPPPPPLAYMIVIGVSEPAVTVRLVLTLVGLGFR